MVFLHKNSSLKVTLLFILTFWVTSFSFYGAYYKFFNRYATILYDGLNHRLGWDLTFLTFTPYDDFSFFLSSFKSPVTYLGVLVFGFLFWKRKELSWDEMQIDKYVRVFFILPGAILCWELLTYDYNYYTDHYFLLERLLLVGFLALIWFHPMYSVWFLIVALLYRAQYDYPLGGFPLFDKKILFDHYILLIAVLLMSTKVKLPKGFVVYFLLVLIAGNYFATALGKIRFLTQGFIWFVDNRLDYLIINGAGRGWPVADEIALFTSEFRVWIQLAVLLLECSTLFLLRSRRAAMVIIVSCMLMHCTILFLGGIFFWKWLLVDMFMLIYLGRASSSTELFTIRSFKLSLLVIPCSFLWMSAFPIGWMDTKYNQTFEYEVELENGEVYNASKSLFNPYHQLFYHDKFLYTVNDTTIKITGFGYTFKADLAKAVNESSVKGIEQLEAEYGKNMYHELKDGLHTAFIKEFMKNYNKHDGRSSFLNLMRAPEHIYNTPEQPVFNRQGKVKVVNVYLNKTFIIEGKQSRLEKWLIKSVEIDGE